MTLRSLASEDEFDELLGGSRPVLALFTAIHSEAAKRMVPVVDDLAGSLGDAITAVQVDVDEASWEDERLEVANVPTLLLLRGDKVIMRTAGERTEDELAQRIAAALAE
ncbi:thioredoxin family protein [Actinocorallia longicatena]|uniref:Thioredoxin domain-containing protein n=1 Tax=Actinocorallia longicatena TaxID=111803 RepID=A0ABP6Q848_9ACTN